MESTIKDRILQFVKFKKLSARQFSLSIEQDRSYLSTMSQDIRAGVVVKILVTYPEINMEWLLLGNGEMLNQDHHEVIYVDKEVWNQMKNELDNHQMLIDQQSKMIDQLNSINNHLISVNEHLMNEQRQTNGGNVHQEKTAACAAASPLVIPNAG